MLTQEQNDALTRTNLGTGGGELLRRFWQPIALSTELPVGSAPVPVGILGEELVLFRDQQNRVGLLDRHCCHRGTDLSFGRLEDGGLRCLYHGWLYDVTGRCLDQPAEPPNSTFKDKVRQTSYPVVERAGAFFCYMGPGEPPAFPNYDSFTYPEPNIHVHKLFIDCNYLQANEGNYDPSHVGFLHKSFDPNRRPGLQLRCAARRRHGEGRRDFGRHQSGFEPAQLPKLKTRRSACASFRTAPPARGASTYA